MNGKKLLSLLLGPGLGLLCYILVDFGPNHEDALATLALLIWMATWWITEVIPLGVTGLLPIIFFPIAGIIPGKEVAPHYANHIVLLFIGGFLIAYAMERWKLHERIALLIINKLGHSPRRLLLGFMLSSYFLSMWISNTATTVMLMAPAIATINQLRTGNNSENTSNINKFAIILLLSVAYSASIGGMTTLVGTPPNLIFYNFICEQFPELGHHFNFLTWMLFAAPISLIFLIIAYSYFCFHLRKVSFIVSGQLFKEKLRLLGKTSFEEKAVLTVFITLAICWMTRKDILINDFTLPGWHRLFPSHVKIEDSTVAIFFAVLLFVIPSKKGKMQLLSLEELKRIPLNIVFMFGGGIALAKGFVSSGLGEILTGQLRGLHGIPTFVTIFIISAFVLFLTEISSNSPTVHLVLPVLVPLANTFGISPIALLLPATIAASYAFMLPISTPPNAIVFESGLVPVKTMMRYGLWLNIMAIVLINLAMYFLFPLIYPI